MVNNFNKILLLKGFNNYFNRIIKKFNKVEDYKYDSVDYNYIDKSINFNPSDGVNAELILNIEEDLSRSDYLLVLFNDEIISRWFIMEVDRIRNGQYKITLRRDVIAENFDTLYGAPIFVEKSIIRNKYDPFIFNKENMGYNQIKKNEEYLKDKSRVPWIVGYISRDYLKQAGEEPEADKSITAKYSVLSGSAIPSSQLPWDFSDSKLILGNCEGYQLTLDYGYADYTVSYENYTHTYVMDSTLTINYDSNGNYTGYDGKDNIPSIYHGTYKLYNASNTNYHIVSTETKVRPFYKRFIDTIINNKLALSKVPNSIISSTTNTDVGISELLSWNNKIVSHANKYYQLSVKETTTELQEFKASGYYDLRTALNEFITTFNDNSGSYSKMTQASKELVMGARIKGVVIDVTEVSTVDVNMTVPRYSRRTHLNDAPYDMFCIPYVSKNLYNEDPHRLHLATANIDCDENVGLAMAFYSAAEMGSNVVYDIQLLPFCPCQEFITDDGILTESYGEEGYNYSYIKKTDGTIVSICIWCNTSSSSFNIDKAITIDRPTTDQKVTTPYFVTPSKFFPGKIIYNPSNNNNRLTVMNVGQPTGVNTLVDVKSIKVGDTVLNLNDITSISFSGRNLVIETNQIITDSIVEIRSSKVYLDLDYKTTVYYERYLYDEAEDIKVSNECDFYRLSSPNYNGQFEFSVAKNGSIDFFNVDYTYKPYQPYIHINPNFKGLYGSDFNDARGLICGGDFSLPMITSAWTDYQVSNKNYQNIFDRQIQNMETNYDIQRTRDQWSAVAGAFSGAATGAATGAMAGGIYGAIAGGVLGGAISAGAGAKDLELNKQTYQESKSYATDMYGYNLGNIKAIPYALSRTSAFTENNKIFPVLEFYSCTDEEKNALRKKIKYNGMTVMRIDTINTFVNDDEETYIQGDLIRNVGLMDDFHMFNECYTELKKGVYL